MAAQERVQKQKAQVKQETQVDQAPADTTNAELTEATEKVVADIDEVLGDQLDEELLADMDDVLEENAEQFVSNYVQQGGE